MNQPLLSISILVSNRIDTIRKCMESIKPLLTQIPCELIAIDTKGVETDGSIDVVREYTDKIYYFEWCHDFAKARNFGMEKCSGKWFMFMDDDEWFEDVTEIVEFFKTGEYKKYHCANYKIHNYDNYDDDYNDYGDDFEYIAPIKEKEPKSNKRQHKFRSSKDLEGFEVLEDLTRESDNKSTSKSSPKKSKSNSSSSKKKSKSDSSSSKKKSKSNSKKKSTSNKDSKSKAKEESEEIEYEDFTDDFFDDGVFGEEGYEALLDDYVEPKKKSKKTRKKASSKSVNKSDKSKDDEPYYDFEGKGADSVFNLDD